ncbi:MAG TPA: hypothetical protein DCF63_10725, partial [Planctomycetaceae bacterium]|nr:hypothetical protein [Planctomycetaceae bacterium]
DANFSFTTAQVVNFLKSMRDRGVPAWQRHQAASAAARYQMMLSGRIEDELGEAVQKLANLAQSERKGDASQAARETHYPPNEPKVITALRETLRRRRYKYDTEKAYVGRCLRFLSANPGREPESLGEPELRSFFNALVTHPQGGVSASTLKQAKSALLFLYQGVLGRELGFLDHSEATKPSKLPVVLTRQEVAAIRKHL